MKIEKINENQIRCTLTKQDLDNHQIRLSELAYGTDKAKQLFRDMMQQAQIQFGFEADNIPLMIEAIPVSAESIILIITKVEDPEELDTRFAKFAPFKNLGQGDPVQFDGADSILDIFQKLREAARQKMEQTAGQNSSGETSGLEISGENQAHPDIQLLRLFVFQSLDDVIRASHGLDGMYQEVNMLYKDRNSSEYRLVIHQGGCSPEDFNKVCNILSEYGSGKNLTSAGEAYLKEHAELISDNALQLLSQL